MDILIVVLGGLAFAGIANWWLIKQELKYYQELVHRQNEDS